MTTDSDLAELRQRLAEAEQQRDAERQRRTEAELREQAVAEVLAVISRSPTDLQAVFDAIVERAARLLDSFGASFHLIQERRMYTVAAVHGGQQVSARVASPVLIEEDITRESALGLPVREGRTVALSGGPDALVAQAPAMARAFAMMRDLGLPLVGSNVTVPLLRAGVPFGSLAVWRPAPDPYSPQQIALLEIFAGQAVIAMENTRLFEELEPRNTALAEALAYQQATSEVLEIISRSPTDLQAVFDAIVERAARLLASFGATVNLVRETSLHLVAAVNDGQQGTPRLATPLLVEEDVTQESSIGLVLREGRTVALAGGLDAIVARYPAMARAYEIQRTLGLPPLGSTVSVPLLRAGVPFGTLNVWRPSPDPYTPRQVALLETFAGQAVIAMENSRLFEDLQASNATLREALQRETATADLLRIISSAPADPARVFEAIADAAMTLCEASDAHVSLVDGDTYVIQSSRGSHWAGVRSAQLAQDQGFHGGRVPLDRGFVAGRAILDGRLVQIADVHAEADAFPPATRPRCHSATGRCWPCRCCARARPSA